MCFKCQKIKVFSQIRRSFQQTRCRQVSSWSYTDMWAKFDSDSAAIWTMSMRACMEFPFATLKIEFDKQFLGISCTFSAAHEIDKYKYFWKKFCNLATALLLAAFKTSRNIARMSGPGSSWSAGSWRLKLRDGSTQSWPSSHSWTLSAWKISGTEQVLP